MNITSYNVTDVAYHYIGLRVLAANPNLKREELTNAVSRSVGQYVRDRALRLMLAAPRGTFETVGEKVCQELVHLELARSVPGSYELAGLGQHALSLLDSRRTRELRTLMVQGHLQHYDNLRYILARHIETGGFLRPIVEAARASDMQYLEGLLRPVFASDAPAKASAVVAKVQNARGSEVAKRTEDALREEILEELLPQRRTREPLFRALADRMNSLRLINIARYRSGDQEFVQTYATCLLELNPESDPLAPWRTPLQTLPVGASNTIWLCEPDTRNREFLTVIRDYIDESFKHLSPEGGYYDLPDVRDFVGRKLRLPEAAFDEALNSILDLPPVPFSLGLQYERISGRRRPLQRTRDTVQIFNLIRRH